jgi:hypothetical protein
MEISSYKAYPCNEDITSIAIDGDIASIMIDGRGIISTDDKQRKTLPHLYSNVFCQAR